MPSRLFQLRSEKPKATLAPAPVTLPIPEDDNFVGAHTRANSIDSSRSSLSSGRTVTKQQGIQHPPKSESVAVILGDKCDLPAVPYKLRFALSPQEWDDRIYAIAHRRERSGRGVYVLLEALWFFFAFAIPTGLSYPLYLCLLNATRAPSKAVAITATLGLVIFAMFTAPLFVRRRLIQRRMNKITQEWQVVDQRRTSDVGANVLWSVMLPGVFQSTCRVVIPVPPRTKTWSLEATLQSDKLGGMGYAGEYGGGAPLSRVDSSSSRSMFED